MINKTVMSIIILSRNPQTYNLPVDFDWNVTEIYNKSFKMKLDFQNLTQLTSRDLLKVRFIKPAIFYINRTSIEKISDSDDIEGTEINEVDR
jgi:hypothetical protein